MSNKNELLKAIKSIDKAVINKRGALTENNIRIPTNKTPQGTVVFPDKYATDEPMLFICINKLNKEFPYIVTNEYDELLGYKEIYINIAYNESLPINGQESLFK